MLPKTFFTIIIKLAGLYITWLFIVMLPQLLSLLTFMGQIGMGVQFLSVGGIIIGQAIIYWFTLRACLFKTDWVIKKLNMDDGFNEQSLVLNMHRAVVLKIAIIILGGIVLIDGIPMFCNYAYTYFQNTHIYPGFASNPSSPWIFMGD